MADADDILDRYYGSAGGDDPLVEQLRAAGMSDEDIVVALRRPSSQTPEEMVAAIPGAIYRSGKGIVSGAWDSFAEGADLARRAGVAKSLGAIPVATYQAGKNIITEGWNTANRWLDATRQLPGARAQDDVVVPAGTEDYQINPNRLQDHDFLAPLGLAGMASPTGSLASGAGRRLTSGVTPNTERAALFERGKQRLSDPAPASERGDRNSVLGTSMNAGGEKYFADVALRQAKGDYDKALALLKDNPEAANVLRYWKEAGYSFRAYEDPVRAQDYWRGLEEFDHAEAPSRLLADQQRSSLPGMVANAARETMERPVSAAIRVGNQVFRGPTHFDAIRNAVPDAVKRDLWGSDLQDAFQAKFGTRFFEEDGFVTNAGRYVDRKEALELLKRADDYERPTGESVLMPSGLDAVELERHNARREGRALWEKPASEAFHADQGPGKTLPNQVLRAFDPENPQKLFADQQRSSIPGMLANAARETDNLGFYSRAIEAARSLPQEKGTPEQMRAMLRSAGVKEAEIQATKLDEFLGLETGLPAGAAKRPSADAWPVERRRRPDGLQAWIVRDPSGSGLIEARLLPDRGVVEIEGVRVNEGARGRGIGVSLYQRLIDAAHAQGFAVESGATVSEPASRVYQALRRRGYSVEQDPAAVAKANEGIHTLDGSGGAVFRVPPSTPADGRTASRTISKSDLVKFLEENRVKVEEKIYGTNGFPLFANQQRSAIPGAIAGASEREGIPGPTGSAATAGAEAAGLPERGGLPRGASELPPSGWADDPYTPLPGQPRTVHIPGHGEIEARPLPGIEVARRDYLERAGLPDKQPAFMPKLDEDRARRIAHAYEAMQHDPTNPEVRAAYEAMIDETLGQLDALERQGYRFKFNRPGEDPYAASPALGYLDVRDKGELSIFPTLEGFGSGVKLSPAEVADNPLLTDVGRKFGDAPITANDAFRAVHDMFGHFGPGNPFFRAPAKSALGATIRLCIAQRLVAP